MTDHSHGDMNGSSRPADPADPTDGPRADVSMDADGRFVLDVRSSPPDDGTRPRLLLRRRPVKGKPQHGSRLVALEPAGGNQWRGVLESDPPLEEGRWDTCLVGAAEEDRTALLPGLRDLRALVSGGEAEHSAPLAVRVPYVTKDGRLAVRAWYRAVHAEAGRIVVEDDVISVTARLLGAQFGDGAAVSLRRRGPGAVARRIPLRPGAKGDFVFTMNCREFTADSAGPGPGTEVAVWDVYVHPDADAPRVRVARLLDDLADRKPVFVYPTAVGDGVTARPYYTVDNDLSVEVASASGP